MTTVIIGEGKISSTLGISNGYPAVIIEPVDKIGIVGEDAHQDNIIDENAIVFEIHNKSGVKILIEDLLKVSV